MKKIKNLQIVNRFDMEDMKREISILLSNIWMDADLNGDTKKKRKFFPVITILCDIAITYILWHLLGMQQLFHAENAGHVGGRINLIMIVSVIVFLFIFFAILGVDIFICDQYKLSKKKQVTKANADYLDARVQEAETLVDIRNIIILIEKVFTGYIDNDPITSGINDLRSLSCNIEKYLEIEGRNILNTYLDKDRLTIDVEMEDGSVEPYSYYICIVKSTAIDNPFFEFSNWDKPALVLKYKSK